MNLLMTLGAALSFTVGGIFMQYSQGLSEIIPSLLVYIFFCFGASFQAVAAQETGMGVTYILVLGLEVVLAILFSIIFFQESYSLLKVLGIILVTIGVVFLK